MGKVGRFGIFGGQYVPETVKDNLLCADITCFYRNNCDTDYCYGKMCAGYACCKHTARHS